MLNDAFNVPPMDIILIEIGSKDDPAVLRKEFHAELIALAEDLEKACETGWQSHIIRVVAEKYAPKGE